MISGGSLIFSRFLFILNSLLSHKQAGALRCALRHLFKNKSGHIIHVTDDNEQNSDSCFLLRLQTNLLLNVLWQKELYSKPEPRHPFSTSGQILRSKIGPGHPSPNKNHPTNTTFDCDYLHPNSGTFS